MGSRGSQGFEIDRVRHTTYISSAIWYESVLNTATGSHTKLSDSRFWYESSNFFIAIVIPNTPKAKLGMRALKNGFKFEKGM